MSRPFIALFAVLFFASVTLASDHKGKLKSVDADKDKFTITSTSGSVSRTCTAGSGGGNPGGCPTSGNW